MPLWTPCGAACLESSVLVAGACAGAGAGVAAGVTAVLQLVEAARGRWARERDIPAGVEAFAWAAGGGGFASLAIAHTSPTGRWGVSFAAVSTISSLASAVLNLRSSTVRRTLDFLSASTVACATFWSISSLNLASTSSRTFFFSESILVLILLDNIAFDGRIVGD